MDPVINSSLATEIVDLAKAAGVMFTIFPVNVFMIAGLVKVALGLFGSAKKVTKAK